MIQFKKIIGFFLVSAIISAASLFLPLKSIQAIDTVWVSGGSLQVQEIGKQLFEQIVQTLKNTLISQFTKITSLKDIWEKMHIRLSESIRMAMQRLLEQTLQTMTNDILSYVNDNDLIIKDFYQYYEEETAKKTEGALLMAAQKTDRYSAAPPDLRPIYQNILDPQNKNDFNSKIRCELSDAAKNIDQDFTWEAWMEYWQNSACNPYGAISIAMDEKERTEAAAGKAAELETTSSGFKPSKGKPSEASTGEELGKPREGEGWQKSPESDIAIPGSVVEEMTKLAMTKDYRQTEQKNADLTDALGAAMPYITNWINSFLNNLLNQGLSAFNNLLGPSSNNPSAPMPPSITTAPEQTYESWADQDVSSAKSLLNSQKLLAENLDQYLSEQDISLNLYLQKKDLQKQILLSLKDLYFGPKIVGSLVKTCPLPEWAQLSENGDIVKISGDAVGSIIFNKTSKAVIEMIYQADSQINSIKTDIRTAQQKIADVNLAVSATENFISSANTFVNQQSDATKQDALTARKAALELGQKPIQSQADNLFQLDADTQGFNLNIVEEIYDFQIKRGSAEAPESGTVYGDIKDFNNTITDLNSRLRSCAVSGI